MLPGGIINNASLVLKVSAAASVVSQALGDLLQHVRQYTSRGEPIGRYDQATDTIMTVTESIFSSMGDAGESNEGEFSSTFKSEICCVFSACTVPRFLT